MFEKEIAEHCNETLCSKCGLSCTEGSQCHDWQNEYNAWHNGAEFGYNKCKAQFDKAKKLLKRYTEFLEYEGITRWIGNTYNETKQFLSEVDK